jgi:hypothetical protein
MAHTIGVKAQAKDLRDVEEPIKRSVYIGRRQARRWAKSKGYKGPIREYTGMKWGEKPGDLPVFIKEYGNPLSGPIKTSNYQPEGWWTRTNPDGTVERAPEAIDIETRGFEHGWSEPWNTSSAFDEGGRWKYRGTFIDYHYEGYSSDDVDAPRKRIWGNPKDRYTNDRYPSWYIRQHSFHEFTHRNVRYSKESGTYLQRQFLPPNQGSTVTRGGQERVTPHEGFVMDVEGAFFEEQKVKPARLERMHITKTLPSRGGGMGGPNYQPTPPYGTGYSGKSIGVCPVDGKIVAGFATHVDHPGARSFYIFGDTVRTLRDRLKNDTKKLVEEVIKG